MAAAPSTDGLLNPGAHRARGLADDSAVLQAILRAEDAWLAAQAEVGLLENGDAARQAFGTVAGRLASPATVEELAAGAESGGNPAIGIVATLQRGLREDGAFDASRAVHRGLTSQDVLDTALMLVAGEAIEVGLASLRQARARLAELSEDHAADLCLARTLTQPAVPSTAGLRIANWVGALDEAATAFPLDLPLQCGGAGGTRAALAEFAGEQTDGLVDAWAGQLGLRETPAPWHTRRQTVLGLASGLAGVIAAGSRIARDVLGGARAEAREFTVRRGGSSSALPLKSNPILAVLLHRAGIEAPGALATVAAAAGEFVDERPDGAWHAEWPALTRLLRTFVVATGQLDDLAAGLVVHPDRMLANLRAAGESIVAERLGYALDGVIAPESMARALAGTTGSLRDAIAAALQDSPADAAELVDLDELFDPAHYLGRSRQLQRRILETDSPLNEASGTSSNARH